MKKVIEIILIILFFLQGTTEYAIYTLSAEILVLVLIILHKNSITFKVPDYLKLAFLIYSVFLLIGLFNKHPNAHIDIKFQFFNFIFYLLLLNASEVNWLRLLFRINLIAFCIYILLYLDLIPNMWSQITFGHKGRLYGPPIIAIILITFTYLLHQKSWDKKYVKAFIMGFIYIGLTTNFMNLMILLLLSFLLLVNIKKLFKPKFLVLLIVMVLSILTYIQSPYAPELLSSKAAYIFDPLEYGSFKIRVSDLKQAIANEKFTIYEKIFGEGFGVGSTIYRENKIARSLSRTFSFQEIDNGFYYLYHRGGWILLSIFIASHIFLLNKIKSIKAKFGLLFIVVITNLLTIHYFNYFFYLIIPFMVLHQNYSNNNNITVND